MGNVGDGREAGVVVLAGFYLADGERRDRWVQCIVLMSIVGCDGVEAWVDVGGDQSEWGGSIWHMGVGRCVDLTSLVSCQPRCRCVLLSPGTVSWFYINR